jgi:hypothetical protein
LTLPGLKPQPLSRPARSQSLYRLRYPGSQAILVNKYIKLIHYTSRQAARVWAVNGNFHKFSFLFMELSLNNTLHSAACLAREAITGQYNFHDILENLDYLVEIIKENVKISARLNLGYYELEHHKPHFDD